ncbi:MAG: glycosyltransferase family 2 protein [Candidatus Latescibacteria bacterium]|nr:glycosyltransferase family 2 protein [Candidatus Latescibacterota bacterium]
MNDRVNDRSKKKASISAYIITQNEEKNIDRLLSSILWMDEIIVLDSGSTDNTVNIAKKLGAKVSYHSFSNYIEQKNEAMSLCTGEWLINLDADEEITPELRKSIEMVLDYKNFTDKPDIYNIIRKTYYMGRWINHCGWYPQYITRMSRRGKASWSGELIHEKLVAESPSGTLVGDLLHRPYGNLGDHLRKMDKYTEMWAHQESKAGRKASIHSLLLRPMGKFIKIYILKAGFLDYVPGLIVAVMASWYTFMKYARLYELSRNIE